jgi:adenosylhomocysteine nucleosidase
MERNLVIKKEKDKVGQTEFKRIAIISAMEVELSYVDEFLFQRNGWEKTTEHTYINEEKHLQLVTKVLGVGKVNAAYQTADLVNAYSPNLIINVGYAGGLVQNAKTGDVAIGTDYVQVDFIPYQDINRPYIADSPKNFVEHLEATAKNLNIHAVSGRIATGDYFLHDTKQKEQIIEAYHPIAFDMESAAIAQVATAKHTDFVSIRTFSDLADEDAPSSFEDNHVIQSGTVVPIERRPITLALVALEEMCIVE